MEDTYPKVQWSLMIGANKQEQWVLRGETIEEVKKLKDELMTDEFQAEKMKQTTPMSYCPTHNVVYDRSGTSKMGRPWSAHKLEDGTMCWKK